MKRYLIVLGTLLLGAGIYALRVPAAQAQAQEGRGRGLSPAPSSLIRLAPRSG